MSFQELKKAVPGESSARIRERVRNVQKIQEERYRGENIRFNGQLQSGVRQILPCDRQCSRLLAMAFDRISFSARSYHRLLKVARTIADMEGEEVIASHHVGEALSYRALEKDSVIK